MKFKRVRNAGGYFHGIEFGSFGIKRSATSPFGPNWRCWQLTYPNTNLGCKVLLQFPYSRVKMIRKCCVCGFQNHVVSSDGTMRQYLVKKVGWPSYSFWLFSGHWRKMICNICMKQKKYD